MKKSSTTALREKVLHLCRFNFLLYKQIEHLQKLDALGEPQKKALKEEKVIELVKYARMHSPFYKELYRNIPSNQSFSSMITALPEVGKMQVKNYRKGILTSSTLFLRRADTSGTSGTPLTLFRSPSSILKEAAYVWQFRMSHGLQPGDPIASMRATLDRNTLYYYNKSANTLYLSSYLLSKSNIDTYVKVLRQFRPKAFCALPSNLYILSNLLSEKNEYLDIPLMFTSSETLYPFQREKIEKMFTGKVIDSYGNAERTIQLGQCRHGAYHEFPLYSYNEYGANGVFTTSLINRSFPLIRYYVDDQLVPSDQPCACGKKLSFSAIEGRFEDAVVLEDGSHVNALGMAFRGINHLVYSQIVQDEYSQLNINLVTTDQFSKSDEETLRSKLLLRLGTLPKLNFNYIGEHEIIKTLAGKYTLVVSRLKTGK